MTERGLLLESGMRALVFTMLIACGTTPAAPPERQAPPVADAGVTTTSATQDRREDMPPSKPRSAAEAAGRNGATPPEQGDLPRGDRDVPGPLAPTAPAETRDPAPKLH